MVFTIAILGLAAVCLGVLEVVPALTFPLVIFGMLAFLTAVARLVAYRNGYAAARYAAGGFGVFTAALTLTALSTADPAFYDGRADKWTLQLVAWCGLVLAATVLFTQFLATAGFFGSRQNTIRLSSIIDASVLAGGALVLMAGGIIHITLGFEPTGASLCIAAIATLALLYRYNGDRKASSGGGAAD